MVRTILLFICIAGFFLLEVVLRGKGAARSLDCEATDRGSTVAVGAAYGIAVLLLAGLALSGAGLLSSTWAGWLGILVMLIGLAFRAWSMRALGSAYSRTLRVSGGQDLVDRGPYRLMRHPGYLGSILVWAGSGIALPDWIAIVVIVPMMTGVYVYRIRAEETMLLAEFGGRYEEYRKRTWRLIPLLY